MSVREATYLLLCGLVMGVATVWSLRMGFVVAVWVGIFLLLRAWLRVPAGRWPYEAILGAKILGVALLASMVYWGLCRVLPATGFATRSCRTVGVRYTTTLHIGGGSFALILVGPIIRLMQLRAVWRERRARDRDAR